MFTLSIKDYDKDNLTLEIINVMGEIVRSEKISIPSSTFQKELTYGLANGMYFLKLSYGKRMTAKAKRCTEYFSRQ